MANERNKNNNYENMCFVMMPFGDKDGYEEGHFKKVYEQIFKPAIEKAGYAPYRVDENKISNSIITEIFEAIQNAPMALCDLSSGNPNVLYELGLRHGCGKPVVLVKDNATDFIFDVRDISTIPYNKLRLVENVQEAQEGISQAIKATSEYAYDVSTTDVENGKQDIAEVDKTINLPSVLAVGAAILGMGAVPGVVAKAAIGALPIIYNKYLK